MISNTIVLKKFVTFQIEADYDLNKTKLLTFWEFRERKKIK